MQTEASELNNNKILISFMNELTEHEFDHVFFGVIDKEPVINISEVEEWEAVAFNDLHDDIVKNPSDYTFWFKEIYEKVYLHLSEIKIPLK